MRSVGTAGSEFTFHHVSIKTAFFFIRHAVIIKFTFHHVSIKTGKEDAIMLGIAYLHSTMFLLKPSSRSDCLSFFIYLHSTMFLLKPKILWRSVRSCPDLHSTMFLLKHLPALQNVCSVVYLHSTMFLLKPKGSDSCGTAKAFTFHHVSIKTSRPLRISTHITGFTFHHVSIKTIQIYPACHNKSYLHSTMFLLKPVCPFWCLCRCLFTFHHVSIKTEFFF